jgi:hypothetical protein
VRLLDQDHSILHAIRDGSLGDMEKMEAMPCRASIARTEGRNLTRAAPPGRGPLR